MDNSKFTQLTLEVILNNNYIPETTRNILEKQLQDAAIKFLVQAGLFTSGGGCTVTLEKWQEGVSTPVPLTPDENSFKLGKPLSEAE